MSELLEFAKDLALRAGSLLRAGQSGYLEIRHKTAQDLVTDQDVKAERFIVHAIRERFPDHGILAEESGEHQVSDGTWRWLIDPLDGTTNYVHRWPHWSVSLALEHAGVVVLGVIYAPVCGELFWAERGTGAYQNGKRMQVTATTELRQALIATVSLFKVWRKPGDRPPLGRLLSSAFKVRQTGCASLDLAWLAAGRLDACCQVNILPWDVAAGNLLVEEAGGRIISLVGAPFNLLLDTALLASNDVINDQMVALLTDPADG
ncbi:MAG: inositol monophosphatase [Cyanobacteria bacterium NC_groundwater_1444_Ag_S-0.65um_54_12]|nr:inositol monophosphatase [Cyanobacteria bacterium NC_groundwater_1444_Ag_S-0.65um_54_12]